MQHALEHITTPTRTIRTLEPARNGNLEVFTTYDADGQIVRRLFTLASLSDVLGVPMSTIEGRYTRGKLKRLKVDIPSYAGRPMRGFDFARFEEVVAIIQTPGAVVLGEDAPVERVTAPLVPTMHNGKDHYTIQALADHFGVSTTTVRNKLEAAGLLKSAVNLGTGENGGRPKRAFPESMLGMVRQAVVDGVSFATEVDQMVARATGGATPTPLQMAHPPQLRVVRGGLDSAQMADDLARQLETLVAGAKVSPLEEVRHPARIENGDKYRITEPEYHRWMERLRNDHVNQPKPIEGEMLDGLLQDLRNLSGLAAAAELDHLVLTPADVRRAADSFVAQWKDKRRLREPELEAVRNTLLDMFVENRTDAPSVPELYAARSVYASYFPFQYELHTFTNTIVAKHKMTKLVKGVERPAEVWATAEFERVRAELAALAEKRVAALAAQHRQATAAFTRLIEQHHDTPDEEVLTDAIDELIAAGVHRVYAEYEIGNVRWYFDAAHGRLDS